MAIYISTKFNYIRFVSGAPTSYAAPASGPVPSGLYDIPVTKTYVAPTQYSGHTGIPSAILKYNNDNNGEGAYRFE